MRLKDGYQTCPRCNGQGCYRCRRLGYLIQCPTCLNTEPEFFSKKDDKYRCNACSTEFTKGGDVILMTTGSGS